MSDLIKREDVIKAVGGTRCVDDIDEEVYAIPIIKTKEIKYFDEDDSVWKIGRVIVDE